MHNEFLTKKIYVFLSFFFLIGATVNAYQEKKIVVVITSFNNSSVYQKNLISVLFQNYSNYEVLYIDDCSPDGTGDLVEQFLVQYDHAHRVTLIKNPKRCGALANHWVAVQLILDHAIVVHLDGDDWFAHKNVLQRVNQAYQDPDVWMTYGQYAGYPSAQLGHCRPINPETLHANSWRNSLILRYSHLRTFYAWLFKRINLDDLLIKNVFFPVSWDNSFMLPMLEMAQYHVRFIPDVLYIYNSENPLNDYKHHLNLQLKIAQYIKQKQHYAPVEHAPDLDNTSYDTAVDMLVFSFDRPLQLYAFLESVERYISGLGTINVLYRASDEHFERAYDDVKKTFSQVNFVRQSQENPHAEFKEKTLSLAFQGSHDYIMFGVDDVIVKDYVDLATCISWLEKTHAYGFFFRMGKNIQKSYLQDLSLTRDRTIANYLELDTDICVWQFRFGKHEWAYPNTLDMTIYRKKDVEHTMQCIDFDTPNILEGCWYGLSDFSNIGVCFSESKIVNIPLNMVQEAEHNRAFFNHHALCLDTKELLNTFNKGFKIDIDPVHTITHISPHIDYMPTFIKR